MSTNQQRKAEQKNQISRRTKEVRNTCVICNTNFVSIRKSQCCSERCRQILRSNKKHTGIEGYDYITCPVCDQRVKQITPKHARSHGYENVNHMAIELKMDTITCKRTKEQVQGKNNPGYQHNGKFSKFSKNFIHGYDANWVKERSKKHSEFRNKNKELFKTNIEYWQALYPEDNKAEFEYKKFQIRDLDFFVNKYGETEGKQRHQQKIEKWIHTMEEKTDEEKMDINARKVKKSGCFYSNAENELFNLLSQYYAMTDQLALLTDEISYNSQAYLYDMAYSNKIIEFNGDFWHSNPVIYGDDFICPYTKRTQQEIHDKDIDKIRIANKHGYEVMVVWEKDYKQDKQKVIAECLAFLTK